MSQIFCPRCGEVLVEHDGLLRCENSMEMSLQLSRLVRGLAQNPPEQKNVFRSGKFWVGGCWFCPACGDQCQEPEPGLIKCPECQRTLGPIVWHCVELWPHPDVPV